MASWAPTDDFDDDERYLPVHVPYITPTEVQFSHAFPRHSPTFPGYSTGSFPGHNPRFTYVSRQRQRRRAEIRQRMVEIWFSVPWCGPPTLYRTYLDQLKQDLKQEAGDCYEEEDFKTAHLYYTQCLEVCGVIHEEGFCCRTSHKEFLRIIYTNRAASGCKLGDYEFAVHDCDEALDIIRCNVTELDPESAWKPLYWKVIALKGLGRYMDAWRVAVVCRELSSSRKNTALDGLMEEIRSLLLPEESPRLPESFSDQPRRAEQTSDDTRSSPYSPEDHGEKEAQDTSNAGIEASEPANEVFAVKPQEAGKSGRKSKKRRKAEQKRREKEMEEIGLQLQEKAKEEALKQERKNQKASEAEKFKTQDSTSADKDETAPEDGEGGYHVVIKYDRMTKGEEDEIRRKGEKMKEDEKCADDERPNNKEGSINGDVQEATLYSPEDIEEKYAQKKDNANSKDPNTVHQVVKPKATGNSQGKSKKQQKSVQKRKEKKASEAQRWQTEKQDVGYKEMTSEDEEGNSSPDEKTKAEEEKIKRTGEETEKMKEDGKCDEDKGSSIDREVQEVSIAATAISAKSPVSSRSYSSCSSPSLSTSSTISSSPSPSPSIRSNTSLSASASSNVTSSTSVTARSEAHKAPSTFVSGKYEFLLACKSCFVKKEDQHDIGAYSYKAKSNHNCRRDVLLARKRNSKASFIKIRPCPQDSFMFAGTNKFGGTYKLCQQFQESRPCKLGEFRCTFAHNEIERNLWTQERQEKFNREEVIAQLRAKDASGYRETESNSTDTETESHSSAELADEYLVNLRRTVYDYKLACDVCFVRDGTKSGVGAYTYIHNKKHNCGENVLLARKKDADGDFQKIRPRPQHAFFGTYKLCTQFQSSMPCMLGEARCTFAHSEIEVDLWTRERHGKFNCAELMFQLSTTHPSKAEAVCQLWQKHGGTFQFLCKQCFQGSPTVITDSSLCDQHFPEGGRQVNIELLVHARETNKRETRFTPIMSLPKLKDKQIPLFCGFLDKCILGGERCGRAHNHIEMDVWMLQRKYGTSQAQLVNTNSTLDTTESLRTAELQTIKHYVECPYRLHFICRQCWLSGRGVVSKMSANGKTCERNKHEWNHANRMCQSIDAKVEIRQMPRTPISAFRLCCFVEQGKVCYSAEECTYAHSEEERKIWTFQKDTNIRDLDVLVNLSQQQHARPSANTNSSTQASHGRVQDFPLVKCSPRVSRYYCNLCHKTCNGKVPFDQHCSSDEHQARVRSDASDNWQYRRPQWIGRNEEYKLCESHAAGACPYDGVEDRHNICPYAHSQAELDEWRERRQHRWLNMEMARKQNLFSYMDKLRDEYEKTTNGPSVIADSLEGVSITCSQNEDVLLDMKGTSCTWAFKVTSTEPLENVSLLINEYRTHFSLHGTDVGENCQVAEGKQFVNLSDNNTYDVEVQGTSQMFGVFHQWVIFDFGKRPVVRRRLVLYVGSVGPSKVQATPNTPDIERWHSGNRTIVRFSEETDPDNEALLAKYKEPIEEQCEVSARISHGKKELDTVVYKTRMHDLLYLEELTRNREISSIRRDTRLELSDRIEDGILLFAEDGTLYTKLRLQDQLSEDGPAGKLILSNVNTVLLSPKESTTGKVYEAAIVQLKGFEGRRKEEIHLQLSRLCCQDLNLSPGTTVEFEVRLQLNRLPFCYMHFAVDNMTELNAIFPGKAHLSWLTVEESWSLRHMHGLQLNARQTAAVTRIVSPTRDGNPPVVLYGPFGTGKTRTLATSALQILQQPGTNVLIATHSNSAADLYLKEYIHPYVTSGHPEVTPLRVYFKERRLETVDDVVMQYCKLDPDKKSFAMPEMEDIVSHRLIIVTLTTSICLSRMGLKKGHFTHILLDEAAQAMECETILPLCLADSSTRIVLAGDHKQISPKVYATEACDLAFDKSLLERMVQRYIRLGKGATQTVENPFLIMLTDNYRCCDEILRFLSESFYGGLKSLGQPRHPRWYPLTFFSAEGEDKTGDHSTSYFNMAEVLEVAERVEQLWKDWPENWGERNMASIGVITPYHNQMQLIRSELRKKRLGGVTVEMVTNIQGKQFRAVFISTVRTRATCDPDSKRSSYGFLSDSKLLNTAMTRAQSLVAVVGDPYALCSRGECQRVWQKFISECEGNKSLFPQTLSMSQIYGRSEGASLNPEATPFTPGLPTTPTQSQVSSSGWAAPLPTRASQTSLTEPRHPVIMGTQNQASSSAWAAPLSTRAHKISSTEASSTIDEPDEIIRQLILESLEDEDQEEAKRFKAEVFDPNKLAVVQSQRDPSQVYLHYSSQQRTSVRRPAPQRLERPRMGADSVDREYDSGEDEPYDPTQLEVQEESNDECFYINYAPDELESLLQTQPDRYKRCRLVVKGTYTAYGEVIGSDEADIMITSRRNRGLGWANDEVVVEILDNVDHESDVFKSPSDNKRGRVVGVLKSAVSLHLRKFVCVVDSHDPKLMVPINTDAPKLVTYFGKDHKRHPHKVRVYSYLSDASIRFKRMEDIDRMDPYKKFFVVRFLKWTPRYVYPLGVVTDVIKPECTVDAGMEILNNRFNVPSKYRGKVEEDVNKRYFVDWQVPTNERRKRKDLTRTHVVFTVDPPEAMDLDDAFSIQENPNGTYDVGIHIADVSAFLPMGSELDKEAHDRATSLYPQTGKPVHMIPKRLSELVCSLLPYRDRLTLSLFVSFDSSAEVVGEAKLERCVVHSRAQLSYKQAEDIIGGLNDMSVPPNVQNSVRMLHKLAAARREKRLGPSHLYHRPNEDEDEQGGNRAHIMVEEMMILANTKVAQVLVQKFPEVTPLRCQQPPKKEKFENWKTSHAALSGCSVALSKELPNDEGTHDAERDDSSPPDDIPLFKFVWDEIRFAALHGDLDRIQQLVCTDENHPTLARALLQLRGIHDRAVFRCSAYQSPEQNQHYSLNEAAYTYFSSPIRRYIDVVVHRLVVALIEDKPSPYTSDEVGEICRHYNNMEVNAKAYERETLVLKLAYDWMSKPEVVYPVIDTLHQQEIRLLMPSVRYTDARQRRVAFNLLKPAALPSLEDEETSVEVRWRQRIYDRAPDKAQLPWPNERRRPLQLDSEKYVTRIPGHYWQRLVQHVQTGNVENIRHVVKYIEDVVGMQLTFNVGPRLFEEVSSEAREGLFADHFCTFQITYKPGQVVKVQLTGDMRKGLLSPCIQLFNLTPKMDVCLDHRREAVTRFAVSATRSVANIQRYRSVEEYQNRWLPIMAVEAAHCAVENNESLIVHGTAITWTKQHTLDGVAYYGEISLSLKFCQDRCIHFNQDYQTSFTAASGGTDDTGRYFDYICVRYTGLRAVPRHDGRFDIASDKTGEEPQLVCWVGHCLVMPGVQYRQRKSDEDGIITVPIKLHQHLMAFPETLLDPKQSMAIPATIEIITKTLPDRRMEDAVRWLSDSSDLIQQIVTGKAITASDNPLASRVTIEPLPAFFPLNQVQEQAVRQAIRQPFTLIQGPPGTGKTVTGVHIAYYLVQMNKLIPPVSGEGTCPPQVLYCGPSNKAVDVVTGYMKRIKGDLKIVRMYSDMIEKEEFPIPNEPVHPHKLRSEKDSKITSEHDDVSLHHLIRKASNPYGEAICAYETIFKDPNYNATEGDISQYKDLIRKAKVNELRQKHVILCTCTAAASPKMGMATNIQQCIVDECGMCTEPESFVPLVGAPVDMERNGLVTFHNPKQVILIGDHQQLRPIVLEKTSQQLGLDTSLFLRYAKQGRATMLTTQYRMHESICSFPSRLFYENRLLTHQSVTTRPGHGTLDRAWPGGANQPTAFCHVVGREEVQTVTTAEGNQMSRSNDLEADMAVRMAISLVKEHGIRPEDVILLSQYRAQVALITKKLSAQRKLLNDPRLERVGVNSVVASQGSEWEYVIFSTVRSLPSYEIDPNPSPAWLRKYLGFITDQNQVNVAITRAKRGLCIIGNKNLLRVHSLWNKLLTDYEQKKCLVTNTNFLARGPSLQNAWTDRSRPLSQGTLSS